MNGGTSTYSGISTGQSARRRIRVALAGLVALAMWLTALPSAATPPKSGDRAKAARLAKEGTRLYDQKKFAQALERFESAHQLVPEPTLIYVQARCLEELGRTDESIARYRAFLKTKPSARGAARAQKRLAALEAIPKVRAPATTAKKDATLVVWTHSGTAEVWIDDNSVGSGEGVKQMVSAGTYDIRVKRPDGSTWRTVARVAAGDTVEVHARWPPPRQGQLVVLDPSPGLLLKIDGRPANVGSGAVPLAPGRHRVELQAPGCATSVREVVVDVGSSSYVLGRLSALDEGPSAQRTAGWTLLGIGSAALVAGITVTALGQADYAQLDDWDQNGRASVTMNTYSDRLDRANAFTQAGWGLLGVGGAAAVTSIILLLTDTPLEGDGEVHITATPMVGGGGLSVTF